MFQSQGFPPLRCRTQGRQQVPQQLTEAQQPMTCGHGAETAADAIHGLARDDQGILGEFWVRKQAMPGMVGVPVVKLCMCIYIYIIYIYIFNVDEEIMDDIYHQL